MSCGKGAYALLCQSGMDFQGRPALNGREAASALLLLLERLGRLTSGDSHRIQRVMADKGQPVAEVLEGEGIITQKELALLLGETLHLPLLGRVRDAVTCVESQASQTATRVAIAMLLEDGLAKLAGGWIQEPPSGENNPQPLPSTTSPAAPPMTTGAPVRRSHRALVVDDDPDLRRIVRTTLERSDLGLTVITAQDADEALALAQLERPDVVILDLSMPGIDGFEMCRRLRKDPQTQAVPILILTGMGTPESAARGRAAGADDYVVKPFQRADFVERIRGMITRAYGAEEAKEAVNQHQ